YSPGIVKDTKLPGGGFFPASASAADQRPPTDDLVSVRCPRDSFPAAIPNNSSGTGSPSSSATSHLTGRTKRSLVRPGRQYMLLGQESAAISRGSVSPRISAAPRPRRTTRAARYSPLGVATRSSFSSGSPTFSANFCAATVGCPSLNAAFTAGPVTCPSASACAAATPHATTASLRGVAKVSMRTACAPSLLL